MSRKLRAGQILLWALAFLLLLRGVDNAFVTGSTVEVREGDTWSKATVVSNSGSDVRIRYEDGTEEVVGPDRVRAVEGAVASPTTPVSGNGAGETPGMTKLSGARVFSADQAVEIKWRGKWLPAHVRQVSTPWIFVENDGERNEKLWVEPWAIRVPGSEYDIEGAGSGSWPAEVGKLAPNERPKKSPQSIGDPYATTPEGQRQASPEDLDKSYDTVSFDNSHDPAVGADSSLHIASTQPTSPFSAWAVRGSENKLDAILPCLNSAKTAVAAFPGSFGKWTTIIRTNLVTHSQLDTRPMHIPDLKVLAAADDGNLLLTIYSGDKNLQLWKWSEHDYKLMVNLRVDASDFVRILSAAFVATDKAVVSTSNGDVSLVDLTQKTVISSIKGSKDAKVFVHPSGQVIGVITSSSTAMLLRPDFSIVAEYDDAGSTSNVSVDATGEWAAYLTSTGVVRVVKIADGSQLGEIAVGGAFKGMLDLVDDKFLLVDHTTAYDVKSGMPVWIYKMPNDVRVAPLINGEFIIAAPGDNRAAIAVAAIPDQVGRAALKTATPDRFVLVPGSAIKLDCDFGAFGDQQQKASDTIGDVLTRAGMKISDKDEAFHLTMNIAAGPTEKREYAPSMFAGPFREITTVDVPSNILTATLTFHGDAVWSQEIRFGAGGALQKDATHSFQDAANDAAKPNAGALNSLNFPSYLPVGAKPGTPAALGASDLQDRRFVPEKRSVVRQVNHS